MTATSEGNSGCNAAKGLDISLAALQRQDPYINNIVDVASQVALYTYNNRTNEWEKTEVEGTLFIYTRLASPRHGFTIMNRLSMDNLTEPITKDLDFQLQDPFLLYRNARLVIHGIWFYDKEDCQRVAQRMKILTHQEQLLAHNQDGWLSPGRGREGIIGAGKGGGSSKTKPVDIIQMLTKARSEFDKEKPPSEPKEIGGSSVLFGNPNLIKPIPVKPNTQSSEGSEPRALSLATLFGSQHHTPHSSISAPPPAGRAATTTGKVTRPPVARTLTYDDAVTSAVGHIALAGGSDGDVRPLPGEESGNVVAVLLSPSPSTQPLQNEPQHCPAIAKLMQGQRSVGGGLQTVSESPENRLCDNGVPLDQHHHLYHHHHQQHHHHHHHHQQQQQLHHDPIKKLFQSHSLPQLATTFSSAVRPTACCSNPPSLQAHSHLSPHFVAGESASCPHLQVQQSQQLFFRLPESQTEEQHSSQTAAASLGTGLPSQLQGVVSPHELLQKLQLVQQEQSLTSLDLPRPHPGLAPRFLGPNQNLSASSPAGPAAASLTAGQKAALQCQVISPQRIPATVPPTQLLAPSVFTQTKPSSGSSAIAQESHAAPATLPQPSQQEEVRALSKSQLQAALLHLIQTDSSFLNSIYEAYVSRFANSSSSKY
uniref:5'-(N(7)-methylguanosine 5'-triphospho)-[mRNA] hydrolase n=1 Tax=Oryzias latipes TaxID=8090 RepID=A0A3P9I3B1_ORYLA